MKSASWIMIVALVSAFALVGCDKKEAPPPVMQGVTVDLPKLGETFATASADLQNNVAEVTMGVRYGDYPRAFAALAKLDSAPGLTEAQKKVVGEVAEQIKQLANKRANPPAQ